MLAYIIYKVISNSLAIFIFWYQTINIYFDAIIVFDLFIYFLFAIEAAVKLILHPKPKIMYFFKFNNIIDVITITLEYTIVLTRINKGIGVGFLRIFKIMDIITALDIIKFYIRSWKGQNNNENSTVKLSLNKRRILSIMLSLTALIGLYSGAQKILVQNKLPLYKKIPLCKKWAKENKKPNRKKFNIFCW